MSEAPPYPSYYADLFIPETNESTVSILFGKKMAAPSTGPSPLPESVAQVFPGQSQGNPYERATRTINKPSHVLHMNPMLAKAMALALLKIVRQMETNANFHYPLPPHIAAMFDIKPEEWAGAA